MDIVTVAMLWFFGAALGALLIGWVVAWLSTFELGLGVGLLVTGIVGLSFATICLRQYRELAAPGPNHAAGEVIAIEDRAVNTSGSVTTPVPVVRFTTGDGAEHTVRGPSASGMKVGAEVTVVYDPADPERARVGQPSQLRGGAIAFMLFGTFPSSVGLWFIHSFVHQRRLARRIAPPAERTPLRRTFLQPLVVTFNLLLLTGILWTGFAPGPLEATFTVGFGVVAAGLWGHGIRGLFDPQADASWCFGMLVLAINFSVWVVALYLLGVTTISLDGMTLIPLEGAR